MDALESDTLWKDRDPVHSDPEILHGEPILKGTRLTPDTLVKNVEAFMELRRMTEDQAIASTLECFPSAPRGGENHPPSSCVSGSASAPLTVLKVFFDEGVRKTNHWPTMEPHAEKIAQALQDCKQDR